MSSAKRRELMEYKGYKKELWESYTNLAYNISGLFAFFLHGDIMYCLALQALGVGSYVWHYYKKPMVYLFDWWAIAFMNMVLAGLFFDNMYVWGFLICFHVVYSYLIMGKIDVYIEVALSALPAIIGLFMNRSLINSVIIFCFFLFAIWVRSHDKDKEQGKNHDSIFHGIWHILTAIAYYMAYYLDL